MPTLNTNTTVHNPETGASQTFPKGTDKSDLPDWAQDGISNPDVWGDEGDAKAEPESPGISISEGESPYGTGSFKSRSAEQVKTLAAAHGLDADTKDEAIAALDAAGIDPDSPEPPLPTSTDTNVDA